MIDEIAAILKRRGGEDYGGQPVTQLQHALQCAALAEKEHAGDNLITAALLHDIGHLLDPVDANAMAAAGIDGDHEEVAAAYLGRAFDDAVTEPIRLHVAAKRYLCAIDSAYADSLSAASQRSLALQGGPLPTAQVAAFASLPHFREAVRLRVWDDRAKNPGAVTPSLDHFLIIARSVIRM